jgi:hypothetical protein
MKLLINFKNFVPFYKMNRSCGDNIFEAFYYALRGKVFDYSLRGKIFRSPFLTKQITTKLETYAIRELIECYGTATNAQAVAHKQLQALLDKIAYYEKEIETMDVMIEYYETEILY